MNNVIQRMQEPTPSFFKKIRNIGLVLGAIGAAIVGAPVAIPALLVKIAGYLVVAGTVASGVSQTAIKIDN